MIPKYCPTLGYVTRFLKGHPMYDKIIYERSFFFFFWLPGPRLLIILCVCAFCVGWRSLKVSTGDEEAANLWTTTIYALQFNIISFAISTVCTNCSSQTTHVDLFFGILNLNIKMKLLNLNQSICLVDLAVPHYPPKKLALRLDDAASGKLATSLNNNILPWSICHYVLEIRHQIHRISMLL